MLIYSLFKMYMQDNNFLETFDLTCLIAVMKLIIVRVSQVRLRQVDVCCPFNHIYSPQRNETKLLQVQQKEQKQKHL